MNPWHARPRNWALTAGAVAALVCAAAWPLPTGYAVGTVASTCALWFGVRKFLTERRPASTAEPAPTEQPPVRCCICGTPTTVYENCYGNRFCWPCADCPCGQNPCVRTGINDPAVSSEAAARARRIRVGDAIRHALKTRAVPALVDGLGRPISGTDIGLSEYDIADVALAELAPDLVDPCPTPETHNWFCPCNRTLRAAAYREAADRLGNLGESFSARQLGEWAAALEQQDTTEGSRR